MEFDKDYVKDKVMNIPGVREAIRNGDYQKVFDLCNTTRKKFNMAQALLMAKVDFLSKIKEIPSDLFRNSPLLSGKLVIPPNIEKIGDMAFFGTDLDEVELPEGLREIGDGAFAQTKIKEVHLPSTVKEVGKLSLGRAKVYINLQSLGGKDESVKFLSKLDNASVRGVGSGVFDENTGDLITWQTIENV